MAIDQTPSPTTPESPVSAIENEFATYRAISSAAILSLVLGLASVFCYADLWFLVVVAASVIAGLVALRNVRRLPDVLTGAVFARIGMGIALLFGMTALTRVVAQEIIVNMDASWFAKHYVELLKDKDKTVAEALWYQQPIAYRKSKSPDEIVEELKKAKSSSGPDPFKERSASIVSIRERLKGQGESIRFVKIESKVTHGLDVYAHALLELDGPGSADFPEKEQFALLQIVKGPQAGPYDWVVETLQFPYTPSSTVATVKQADDGHGHSH